MKCALFTVFVVFSLYTSSAYSARAYIIQADKSVALINHKGDLIKVLSEPDFAIDISYGKSRKLWALTSKGGHLNAGGNTMALYQKAQSWLLKPGHSAAEYAVSISASAQGKTAWFADGVAAEIKPIWSNGIVMHSRALPGEGFLQLSAETSDMIWAISERATRKGNPVTYMKANEAEWTQVPNLFGSRVSAGWVVTHEGKVVKVNDEGEVKEYSAANFARDISVGPSGRVWVLTHEPVASGGSVIKMLKINRKGNHFWKTIPNLGAHRITAR